MKKVIIIGAINCEENDLRNYAYKHFNMQKDNLIIIKDYNKIKDINFFSLKNPDYTDIIFAKIPHSAGKHGQYSSMMQKLECEPGYPNVIRLRNMKLTISSFKKAMLISRYLKEIK